MEEKDRLNLIEEGYELNDILLNHKNDVYLLHSLFLNNLMHTLEIVNNKPDSGNIDVITDIYFQLRKIDVFFTIEILHSPVLGNYISWCPELSGSFAEGITKLESLKNLLFVIAEIFVLNYDILKVNPFSLQGKTPIETNSEIHILDRNYSLTTCVSILKSNGFKCLFVGFQNLLTKRKVDSKETFIIPFNGVSDFARNIIINMIISLKK